MISDVLCDAVTAIERYRADPIFGYPEDWPEMDALVEAMEVVRRTLDAPPI
ncbi:hypothetical protein QH494_26275 [Sphingomonas sp. AR_OL41]|uniref:hypothetical protein n=1 Tax=Sphingomonas sp. AR_OL41 TaxID=3042729 RepID=UPI002480F8E4|nr:hypothetical protein [Sphingomonas sp. AR_OL41]MDH7975708.1 hypothetical protein [Sphingomonas sp. AR_OL41]